MSGFIATGTTPPAETIVNDGFWPDVDVEAYRGHMRMDATVSQERLRSSLTAAILSVNDELAQWKALQVEVGHATLAEVPAPQVNQTSRFVLLYQRAVACCAAAELTERYRSFDATDSANQRADDLNPSIDELRRDQRWAIRDFLGARRMTVELI